MTDDKSKRKALGRGLGALIPKNAASTAAPVKPDGTDASRAYFYCNVGDIRPNVGQPRRHFDEAALQELAQSISESGLIQPLVVRKVRDHYELIAGERRWRASKLAGLSEVPVVVRELADDEAFVLALVENIQRQDLNPIEEAAAYQRLLEEYKLTQQAVADKVGRSRPVVANALRLLTLPSAVRDKLSSGELTTGHAKILVTLPADEAIELAEIIVRHELSVREAEDLARQSKDASDTLEKKPVKPLYRDDVHVRDIAQRLQTKLGTRVMVKDRKGKGRIEIHYDNYDVLDAVLEYLKAKED